MTSAYYESLGKAVDAPITGAHSSQIASYFDPAMSEEPDMVEKVNLEVDRVERDRQDQYTLLANQYNQMFQNQNDDYSRLQRIIGKQVPGVVRSYQKWDEATKPTREAYARYKRAKEYNLAALADPDIPDPTWIKGHPRANEILTRIKNGELLANDDDVLLEDDVKPEEQASQEQSNAIAFQANKEGETGVADAVYSGPPDSMGQGIFDKQRQSYRDQHTLKDDYEHWFWNVAADTMKVPVRQADGTYIHKNFYGTRDPVELRQIADAIAFHYLDHHNDKAGGRVGRYKKNVMLPIFSVTDTKLKAQYEQLGIVFEETAKEIAAEDLKNRIENDPGHFIDNINLNVGLYDGSFQLSRAAAVGTISRYAETGILDRPTIEKLINHPFTAHDGQETTVGKYWKKEADEMIAAVNKYETEEANRQIADHKAQYTNDASNIAAEAAERKTPYTEEEKWKLVQDFKKRHRLTDAQVPNELKNLFTSSTVPDADLDRELTERYIRGESLKLSDLSGFGSIDMKKKWAEKITGSGVDQETRDWFISAAVSQKTQETDLEKAKTIKWRAYQSNALAEYNRVFLAEKGTGATDEQAATKAREAVIKGLDLGKPDDSSWAHYGAASHGLDAKAQLGRAQKALGADITLLDSKEPWEGEEPAIRDAIRYFQRTKTNIPVYYRNFPGIRTLPNGKAGDPMNIMRYRLTSLGLMKEGELELPSDNIPPYLQQLLRKPNPSKTLRVINDEEGIRIIDASQFSSYDKGGNIETDAVEELRSKAQISQQYAVIDQAYRTLVQIPSELNDEFVAQVGELPPYLQLNNLQPEVAKAFVADVLMV